jgi:ribosomal protein L7/L12
MKFFLIGMILVLSLILVAQVVLWLQMRRMRHAGKYPRRGNAVMADVVRLLDDNKRICAIRCYREVNKCSLREAKDAVKALSEI